MKKLICAMLLLALLLCAAACSDTDIELSDEASLVCDLLEELIDREYVSVNVTVVTNTEFAQLFASYCVSENSVTYSIEQLNLLPSLDGTGEIPPDAKTLTEGVAVIENGEIVEINGEGVTLPEGSALTGKFNFDAENLQNIVAENGILTADVISPSQFYGVEVDMKDVKVAVKYSDAAIDEITVSYSTEKATVQATYEFEG